MKLKETQTACKASNKNQYNFELLDYFPLRSKAKSFVNAPINYRNPFTLPKDKPLRLQNMNHRMQYLAVIVNPVRLGKYLNEGYILTYLYLIAQIAFQCCILLFSRLGREIILPFYCILPKILLLQALPNFLPLAKNNLNEFGHIKMIQELRLNFLAVTNPSKSLLQLLFCPNLIT